MSDININSKQDKANKMYRKQASEKYNNVVLVFEVFRKNLALDLNNYKKKLKELGAVLREKDNYIKKSDNFEFEGKNSIKGKLIHPLLILFFVAVLYTCELLLIHDMYNEITSFMSAFPFLQRVLLFLAPLILIIGFYMMVAIVSPDSNKNISEQEDFDDSIYSKNIYPRSKKQDTSSKEPDSVISIVKYTPILVVIFFLISVFFDHSSGYGEKSSFLVFSVILIGIHFVAISLFDRIVLSVNYYYYDMNIKGFDKEIIELDNDSEDILLSFKENLLQFDRAVDEIKKMNPKAQPKIILSKFDLDLLASLGFKSVNFGSDNT